MSLFAGIYSLDDSIPPDPSSVDVIRRSISRCSDDHIDTFQDQRFFLAKVDVDAFRDPAFFAGERVATITGEPVLDPRPGSARSRAEELARLSRELSAGNYSILLDCYGSFSLCHYNPSKGSLLVCTDRVGVRAV